MIKQELEQVKDRLETLLIVLNQPEDAPVVREIRESIKHVDRALWELDRVTP